MPSCTATAVRWGWPPTTDLSTPRNRRCEHITLYYVCSTGVIPCGTLYGTVIRRCARAVQHVVPLCSLFTVRRRILTALVSSATVVAACQKLQTPCCRLPLTAHVSSSITVPQCILTGLVLSEMVDVTLSLALSTLSCALATVPLTCKSKRAGQQAIYM
jgi:hypothetical protein